MKFAPRLHRKLWEDAYVVQCLWERGCLEPGKSGLGFAVGVEALPSLFVSSGARITATDLAADDERSHGWSVTHQHASTIEVLWKPDIVARDRFLENCSFEPVDMTSIPPKFDGQFDFCWSVCAFEHLGTLQKGLEFVRQATRALKPGGVAVHTTEYNVGDGETIDNWPTVLYQKRHFATLQAMIEEVGCRLVDIDFDVGREFFDCYVDLPPYPHDESGLAMPPAPHVKLSVDGFPTTSIAIIVEKPVDPITLGRLGFGRAQGGSSRHFAGARPDDRSGRRRIPVFALRRSASLRRSARTMMDRARPAPACEKWQIRGARLKSFKAYCKC